MKPRPLLPVLLRLLTLLTLLTVPACLTSPAAEADGPIAPMQTSRHFKRKFTRTLSSSYLLFLPRGYSPRSAQRWPVLMFLHGSGERGTELAKVRTHGPPKLVGDRPDFPFIVVSPQCPADETWSDDVLLALLDDVLARHRVDPTRVYLTGLSMGGNGTWSLALHHPERFAAVAPVCGWGETPPRSVLNRRQIDALQTLGVWAFHGRKDTVVKPAESERMLAWLQGLGVKDAQLTLYPDVSHNSWVEAYNNEELYRWFLKHQRPGPN